MDASMVQKNVAAIIDGIYKSAPLDNKDKVSARAWNVVQTPCFESVSMAVVAADTYDKATNPQGIVNFAVSVNYLCEDLLAEQLKVCESSTYDIATHHYFSLNGELSFRQAIAEFMTDQFETVLPVKASEIFVVNGATGVTEFLGFSLAEPGDYFLCMRPYYYRTKNDLNDRAGVLIYDNVPENELLSDDSLTIEERLNALYKSAKMKGHTVRGIFIINPNNPTGEIYSKQELQDIVDFAYRHDLHVISDEIYALSVFDEHSKFISILALPDIPDRSRIHVIWGFSKDFGLAGYRCGVLWTCNQTILEYASRVAIMTAVPLVITAKLEMLIRNKEWVNSVYLPTNTLRLRQHFRMTKDFLDALGIPVIAGKAGFFIWMDLSEVIVGDNPGRLGKHAIAGNLWTSFLNEKSFQGERRLTIDLMDAGVSFYPGEMYCSSKPGWFRMIFTIKSEELNIGLERIKTFVNKFRSIETRTLTHQD